MLAIAVHPGQTKEATRRIASKLPPTKFCAGVALGRLPGSLLERGLPTKGLEQAREEGGDGSFDAQDTFTELHRL